MKVEANIQQLCYVCSSRVAAKVVISLFAFSFSLEKATQVLLLLNYLFFFHSCLPTGSQTPFALLLSETRRSYGKPEK